MFIAKNFDGQSWVNWKPFSTIDQAVAKIKENLELEFSILDVQNKQIWVSNETLIEREIKSALVNHKIEVSESNVFIGFPK